MSQEHFFESHPAGPELRSQLAGEIKRTGGLEQSDGLLYFASKLVTSGREGVLEIVKHLEREDLMDGSREDGELVLERSEKERAAVWFGNLVVSLDDMIRNGWFDLEGLIDRVNDGLRGTPIPKFELGEYRNPIEIPQEKLNEMIQLRDEDSTFSSFFRKQEYLPEDLREYLYEHDNILDSPHLRKIIDKWELRTRFIVSKKGPTLPPQTEGAPMLPGVPAELQGFSAGEISALYILRDKYKPGDS